MADFIATSHVEIRPSPLAGNGLFVTKNVKKGDIIWSRDRPLISEVQPNKLAELCSNCFSGQREEDALNPDLSAPALSFLNACMGCRTVKYCSKSCQRDSWKRYHKYECKLLSTPGLPDLSVECKAAIRLGYLLRNPNTSDGDKKDLAALYSGYKQMSDDFGPNRHAITTIHMANEIVNRVEKEAMGQHASSDRDAGALNPRFAQIVNNAFEMTESIAQLEIGIAVDPIPCAANHSCTPTAAIFFDGPSIYMHALADMEGGEEVFTTYVLPHDPVTKRREWLASRYHFTCVCQKCLDQQRWLEERQKRQQARAKDGTLKVVDGIDVEDDEDEEELEKMVETARVLVEAGAPPTSGSNIPKCEKLADELWTLLPKIKTVEQKLKQKQRRQQQIGTPNRERQQQLAIQARTLAHWMSGTQDLLVTALNRTLRHLQLLQAAVARHYRVDPNVYPDQRDHIRQLHTWDLIQVIWRTTTAAQRDPTIIELLRSGGRGGHGGKKKFFDLLPVLYRIHSDLLMDLRRMPGRARFRQVVEAHFDAMFADIRGLGGRGPGGPEGALRVIRDDVEGCCARFERLVEGAAASTGTGRGI